MTETNTCYSDTVADVSKDMVHRTRGKENLGSLKKVLTVEKDVVRDVRRAN